MEQLQDSSLSDSELTISTAASSSSLSDSVSTSVYSSSDSESSCLQSAVSESSTQTLSTVSSNKTSVQKPPPCFFDTSTCKRQNFSITEKIVFYMAKNATNAVTFQKLTETCKYFFKVNPVIVVPMLIYDKGIWYACYDVDGQYRCKIDSLKNVKIWIPHELHILRMLYCDVSLWIPKVYKNDATVVNLHAFDQLMTLEEFVFIADNAEKITMTCQTIKYKNGEIVPFEIIIENLPKLKSLYFNSFRDERIFTKNTAEKLMKIEHFKNITYLELFNLPETFNVETMFYYILENKQIQVYLHYSYEVSNHYKEMILKYSSLLENENGCVSKMYAYRPLYELLENPNLSSSSEDISSDTLYSVADENEDLLCSSDNEEDEEWHLA